MLSGKPHRNDISYSCIVFIPNLHCTKEERAHRTFLQTVECGSKACSIVFFMRAPISTSVSLGCSSEILFSRCWKTHLYRAQLKNHHHDLNRQFFVKIKKVVMLKYHTQ